MQCSKQACHISLTVHEGGCQSLELRKLASLLQLALVCSAKRVVKRGRRSENEYLVVFPDFEGDDVW